MALLIVFSLERFLFEATAVAYAFSTAEGDLPAAGAISQDGDGDHNEGHRVSRCLGYR